MNPLFHFWLTCQSQFFHLFPAGGMYSVALNFLCVFPKLISSSTARTLPLTQKFQSCHRETLWVMLVGVTRQRWTRWWWGCHRLHCGRALAHLWQNRGHLEPWLSLCLAHSTSPRFCHWEIWNYVSICSSLNHCNFQHACLYFNDGSNTVPCICLFCWNGECTNFIHSMKIPIRLSAILLRCATLSWFIYKKWGLCSIISKYINNYMWFMIYKQVATFLENCL